MVSDLFHHFLISAIKGYSDLSWPLPCWELVFQGHWRLWSWGCNEGWLRGSEMCVVDPHRTMVSLCPSRSDSNGTMTLQGDKTTKTVQNKCSGQAGLCTEEYFLAWHSQRKYAGQGAPTSECPSLPRALSPHLDLLCSNWTQTDLCQITRWVKLFHIQCIVFSNKYYLHEITISTQKTWCERRGLGSTRIMESVTTGLISCLSLWWY